MIQRAYEQFNDGPEVFSIVRRGRSEGLDPRKLSQAVNVGFEKMRHFRKVRLKILAQCFVSALGEILP